MLKHQLATLWHIFNSPQENTAGSSDIVASQSSVDTLNGALQKVERLGRLKLRSIGDIIIRYHATA